jgi:hypothetical protein
MPTNVTPEYKKAEEAYRKAREPKERLDCLRQMLSTIPKHKGTEHLQADIKSRIKDLTEELAGPKKGRQAQRPGTDHPARGRRAGRAARPAELRQVGAAPAPHRLARPVGPGPFITQFPEPGMLSFEDIAFQLLDLPSMSADHSPPWIARRCRPVMRRCWSWTCPTRLRRAGPVHPRHAGREKKISLCPRGPGPRAMRARRASRRRGRGGRPVPHRAADPAAGQQERPRRIPEEVAVLEELLASTSRRCASPRDRPGARRARALAVPGAGDRARLHQGARQGAGARPAVHRAARRHRAGRRAPGPQGHRGEFPLRAPVGQRAPSTASRSAPITGWPTATWSNCTPRGPASEPPRIPAA